MPPSPEQFILGEYRRTVDERFRLSIPGELADLLETEGGQCILAKERTGCVSLWSNAVWQSRLDASVDLVQTKMRAGRLEGRLRDVQHLGRLLSTRHKPVQLAGRGRLVIPEGFREFLNIEPGDEVLLVGAAVCIEIWNRELWIAYLHERMPEFGELLDDLSG